MLYWSIVLVVFRRCLTRHLTISFPFSRPTSMYVHICFTFFVHISTHIHTQSKVSSCCQNGHVDPVKCLGCLTNQVLCCASGGLYYARVRTHTHTHTHTSPPVPSLRPSYVHPTGHGMLNNQLEALKFWPGWPCDGRWAKYNSYCLVHWMLKCVHI